MKNIRTFVIVPSLPELLEPLRQLAYNLWWTWNPTATDLFRRLDVDLWRRVGHNPVALLWQVSQARLIQAARDDAYVAQLCRVMDSFYVYMNSRTWFDEHYPSERDTVIAYFSAEFGLHESMPIYSGGLGVLAGDHLKSASDLGVPLVAVGLAYRHGYFKQQLTEDGWQLESYPVHDPHQWCATPVLTPEGHQLQISVPLGTHAVHAGLWLVNVGRVKLYLLDTDIPDNPPELRGLTARLYGGDGTMRIRQEMLLGIGGLRALRTIGIHPLVCHMNEGHAAFLALERIRLAMREHNLSYREAREAAFGGNIFTTHTPVPAGIDRFDPRIVEQHLGWMAHELGISMRDLLALGREHPDRNEEEFCMPLLALRMSYRSNGVSKLHGDVARGMWQGYWPGIPREEVPITHITNGIHTRTWTSPTMADLFDQYLAPGWAEADEHDPLWRRIAEIPDAELWRVHVRRREWMIAAIRRRLRDQLKGRGAPPAEIKAAEEVLDPEALTIGFARRFAPYKRATLIFRNLERLAALIGNRERPVQFIFAGKAHPNDGAGKELIKHIAVICARPEFRRRIVFLENYDISLARVMVQGIDVWLNNPLRLHEASGTSGMKVPANGGLNLSCLDGWWPEAYNGENGWAIGDGRVYDDLAYQDHVESESLYNLLEREIVPLFYERTIDDLPRQWVARMKESMKTIVPVFNTNRMLREYAERMYLPALRRVCKVRADDFAMARALSTWKDRLRSHWHEVRVAEVQAPGHQILKVGDQLPLLVRIRLGPIPPEDVAVEAYWGPLTPDGEITSGSAVRMKYARAESNGEHWFEGAVPCQASGRNGYAIRVVPCHEDLADRYDQGLVVWG
ncbi:MAG: alpha-glucan family phosphorylase [Phycisphaerae bacterium]|nr:alpha-glucan family phosphorylase [Phycisphaerae bacterium]